MGAPSNLGAPFVLVWGAHAPSRVNWKARPRACALRYGGAFAEMFPNYLHRKRKFVMAGAPSPAREARALPGVRNAAERPDPPPLDYGAASTAGRLQLRVTPRGVGDHRHPGAGKLYRDRARSQRRDRRGRGAGL
jgi:hypothetical protein